MIQNFPADIREFLTPILEKGYRVWIFGSRANGTSNQNSDWDFIVFGDDELLSNVHLVGRKPKSMK